jgi:hypothetical protein
MLMHAERFSSAGRADSRENRVLGDDSGSVLKLARKLEHDALTKPGINPVLKAFMLRQAEERYRYLGDEADADRLQRIIGNGFSGSRSIDLDFVKCPPELEIFVNMMRGMNSSFSFFGMYSMAFGTAIIAMEMGIADTILKLELGMLKRF